MPDAPSKLSTWRAVRLLLGVAFEADRRRAVLTVVVAPLLQASTQLNAYWLKLAVDGLLVGATAKIVYAVIGTSLVQGVSVLVITPMLLVSMTLTEEVVHTIQRRITRLLDGIPSVAPFEDPSLLDRLSVLEQRADSLGGVIGQVPRSLGTAAAFLMMLGLLASVSPWLLVLPIVALPEARVRAREQAQRLDLQVETASAIRRATHLLQVATQPKIAQEVRLFGYATGLQRQLGASQAELRSKVVPAYREMHLRGFLAASLAQAGFVGAIAFTAWMAIAGRATPGDVALAVTIVLRVGSSLQELGRVAGARGVILASAEQLHWLTQQCEAIRRNTPGDQPVPDVLRQGIRFRGVRFRYPGTEPEVLSGVDFDLPAGSVVAIVGDNGAGKTTLVKLLCRFYEPDAGEILVDGQPLAALDASAWQRRVTAAFQDFARLELSLQESIGIGAVGGLEHEAAVLAALERVGAERLLDDQPEGLHTQLGRTWPGGVELSGGQWQQVALARAAMAPEPLLVVLDEPTAAIDPETEHALFERMTSLAHASAGRGAITVLVSHRFSTVRMADLIIVIEDGRITEVGSHTELVAAGKTYAELFELQARAYR